MKFNLFFFFLIVAVITVNCQDGQQQQESGKDLWGDFGKELTNTWNTVKKVATKVIQVVDKIFKPAKPSFSMLNVTQSSSNGTDWSSFIKMMGIKIKERQRKRRFESKAKFLERIANETLTECSGRYSYEKFNSFKTAIVCRCQRGYQFNENKTCVDVNECEEFKDNHKVCGPNSQCINTDGWYMCKCPPGYTGDAVIKCVAVDRNVTNVDTTTEPAVTTKIATEVNPVENEVVTSKPSEGLVSVN